MLRGCPNRVLDVYAPEVQHTSARGAGRNLATLLERPKHLLILPFQASLEVGHNTFEMLSDRVSVLFQSLERSFHVLQVGLINPNMKVGLSTLGHNITDLSPIRRNCKDRFVESQRQHDAVKPGGYHEIAKLNPSDESLRTYDGILYDATSHVPRRTRRCYLLDNVVDEGRVALIRGTKRNPVPSLDEPQ